MGSLYCITSYQVGDLSLAQIPPCCPAGFVWRDTRIPIFMKGCSDSYRVWNYVWGDDPSEGIGTL